jgi:hypothetical protein
MGLRVERLESGVFDSEFIRLGAICKPTAKQKWVIIPSAVFFTLSAILIDSIFRLSRTTINYYKPSVLK